MDNPDAVRTQSPGCVDVRAQGASVVQVETSRFLPWMVLAVMLAGVAFGLSVTTLYIQSIAYRELERETRLLALKYDDLRVALLAQDIDVSKHHAGESP